MVGDNEHDAAAAHGAGLPFVLMTYGYARTALDEIAADRRLADFAALPAAIQSLP
jgi:phosphoglycolate phosphatase